MKTGEGIIGSFLLAVIFGCVASWLTAPTWVIAAIVGIVFIVGVIETLIEEKK